MSASITSIKDPVDTVLTVYGPNGQVVAYNDDQFEPSDSSIFDVSLPSTGTYTVEVECIPLDRPVVQRSHRAELPPGRVLQRRARGVRAVHVHVLGVQTRLRQRRDPVHHGAPAVSTSPQVTMSTESSRVRRTAPSSPSGPERTCSRMPGRAAQKVGPRLRSRRPRPWSPSALRAVPIPGRRWWPKSWWGRTHDELSSSLDGVTPIVTYHAVSGDPSAIGAPRPRPTSEPILSSHRTPATPNFVGLRRHDQLHDLTGDVDGHIVGDPTKTYDGTNVAPD